MDDLGALGVSGDIAGDFGALGVSGDIAGDLGPLGVSGDGGIICHDIYLTLSTALFFPPQVMCKLRSEEHELLAVVNKPWFL